MSGYDNFERFDWKMDQCFEWWDEMATRLMGRDKFANNFDEIVQVSLTRRNWLVVVCWPERFWTGVGCFQVLSYNKNNSSVLDDSSIYFPKKMIRANGWQHLFCCGWVQG